MRLADPGRILEAPFLAHLATGTALSDSRALERAAARLRPTTAFRYTQMTERYVLPRIGRVPLHRLTVTRLYDLYAELRRSGRQDGKPLAPKTVLNVHQILRTALGDAERQGLVARNVARLVGPPCHGIQAAGNDPAVGLIRVQPPQVA